MNHNNSNIGKNTKKWNLFEKLFSFAVLSSSNKNYILVIDFFDEPIKDDYLENIVFEQNQLYFDSSNYIPEL